VAASAPAAAASAPVPALLAPALNTPPSPGAARVISLAPALIEAAREHQIDPLLLHAIAHIESRHNPKAVSKAGARGVMQVMPATGKRFGVTNPEHNLLDAPTNLRASAAYLRTLRQRYGDDLRLVLAAYNAGEGAVAKAGGNVPPYPETQAYVRDVLAVYRRLTSSFSVSANGELVSRGGKS
jgi:soluble lytic murein transglycosylase-like protein